MAKYARVIGTLVVAVTTQAQYDAMGEDIKDFWQPVPDHVVEGSKLVDGAWEAPAPVDPPPPKSFYLAKVTFERRFGDTAFAALDSMRVTIRNRPADWATTSDAPWALLRSFVRPMISYDAAERINVLDPEVVMVLVALQGSQQIFGSDETAAAAEIARILTPDRLPEDIG